MCHKSKKLFFWHFEEEDSDDENVIEVKLNDGHAETALGDTLIQKEGNKSREEQIENEKEVIEIYL